VQFFVGVRWTLLNVSKRTQPLRGARVTSGSPEADNYRQLAWNAQPTDEVSTGHRKITAVWIRSEGGIPFQTSVLRARSSQRP